MTAKDYILTNHAREQMVERGMKEQEVLETLQNSDSVTPGKKIGTEVFRKKFDGYTITVIGKHNEKHQWIAISTWRDPPLPGTKDARQKEAYKQYQKAGFWKKIFLAVKSQIGF